MWMKNFVDPDQLASSDQDSHCLQMMVYGFEKDICDVHLLGRIW